MLPRQVRDRTENKKVEQRGAVQTERKAIQSGYVCTAPLFYLMNPFQQDQNDIEILSCPIVICGGKYEKEIQRAS